MSVADMVAGFMADPIGHQQAATNWAYANLPTVAMWAGGAVAVSAGAGLAASVAVDGVRNRLARLREERENRKRLVRAMGGLREARRAGLCRNPRLKYSAIVLGRIGRTRLTWLHQEPVLITGGTRSGKGVGLIRPTLLTYGGPVVSYDGGKGEAFDETSGWRSRFSHVLNLDLTNRNGVHWNPLEEIRPEFLTRDVENLVQAIPRPANSDGHFEPAADSYMGAVIIHVLLSEPDGEKCMAGVLRFISKGDEGARRIILAKAHPVAVARATSLFGSSEEDVESDEGQKYRQSVYNSARVRLKAYEDDIAADVTGRSDFRLADLLVPGPDGRPVTLYLSTPASDDDRVRPIISMFLSMFMQAVLANPKVTSDGREKVKRGLMLVDEFPSLRMAMLETAITKIVGCRWTMFLGAQSLSALGQAPYGPLNQFKDNIRCSVHFAANDESTQRFISSAIGDFPEVRESTSRSTRPGMFGRSKTTSESETRRPVMSLAEVRMMRDDEEVILIRGQPAILATKVRDYGDRILKKRMRHKPAPMRGADGVYPDLPWPARGNPWAGKSMVIPNPPPKRLSIGNGGGTGKPAPAGPTIVALPIPADDLPPAPEWADEPTDTTKTAEALAKPAPKKPGAPRIPKLPPKVAK
jgi:type IV secretion system protein VirD4